MFHEDAACDPPSSNPRRGSTRFFFDQLDDPGGTSVRSNKSSMRLHAQHSGLAGGATAQVNATITQWASREFGGIANDPIGCGRECPAL